MKTRKISREESHFYAQKLPCLWALLELSQACSSSSVLAATPISAAQAGTEVATREQLANELAFPILPPQVDSPVPPVFELEEHIHPKLFHPFDLLFEGISDQLLAIVNQSPHKP